MFVILDAVRVHACRIAKINRTDGSSNKSFRFVWSPSRRYRTGKTRARPVSFENDSLTPGVPEFSHRFETHNRIPIHGWPFFRTQTQLLSAKRDSRQCNFPIPPRPVPRFPARRYDTRAPGCTVA